MLFTWKNMVNKSLSSYSLIHWNIVIRIQINIIVSIPNSLILWTRHLCTSLTSITYDFLTLKYRSMKKKRRYIKNHSRWHCHHDCLCGAHPPDEHLVVSLDRRRGVIPESADSTRCSTESPDYWLLEKRRRKSADINLRYWTLRGRNVHVDWFNIEFLFIWSFPCYWTLLSKYLMIGREKIMYNNIKNKAFYLWTVYQVVFRMFFYVTCAFVQ